MSAWFNVLLHKDKLNKRKRHGCRNFILYCLIVAAVWYFGTFTLKTTEVTVETTKIENPITIVQISDLHGSEFGADNAFLIDAIEAAKPDFVIVTGDMYTAGDMDGQDTAVALMHRLAKMFPVYFVHGEHDNDRTYEQRLADAGVDVLDYEWRDIRIGESVVRLYGITNVYYTETFDLTNEFTLDQSVYNILAAHIAKFEAFADFGMDLSLCGDSHGGQVRLPFVGALTNGESLFPERKSGDRSYMKGLYALGDSQLFISSGLGNYPIPFRFWNRPEVAVIRLIPE